MRTYWFYHFVSDLDDGDLGGKWTSGNTAFQMDRENETGTSNAPIRIVEPAANPWSVALSRRTFSKRHILNAPCEAGQYSDYESLFQPLSYCGGYGLVGGCIGAVDAENYHAAYLVVDSGPVGRLQARVTPFLGRLVIGSMVEGVWTQHYTGNFSVVRTSYETGESFVLADLRLDYDPRDRRLIVTASDWGRHNSNLAHTGPTDPITIEDLPLFATTGKRVGIIGRNTVVQPQMYFPRIEAAAVDPWGLYVRHNAGEPPVHQVATASGVLAPGALHQDDDGTILEENEAGTIVLAPGTPYTMLSSDRILIGTAAAGPADPGWGDIPWNSGEFDGPGSQGFGNAPWGDNPFN